ncbi:hypothetical protein V8G54_021797 [Vigna mungo]|uniref:Uncharacterized protein n=1 Tax=Vigna mungo TaxID=3915 RepID=A0AAQ3NG90_VIGMU
MYIPKFTSTPNYTTKMYCLNHVQTQSHLLKITPLKALYILFWIWHPKRTTCFILNLCRCVFKLSTVQCKFQDPLLGRNIYTISLTCTYKFLFHLRVSEGKCREYTKEDSRIRSDQLKILKRSSFEKIS